MEVGGRQLPPLRDRPGPDELPRPREVGCYAEPRTRAAGLEDGFY